MIHETRQALYWSILLENTRLLVKGVRRLHQDYERETAEAGGPERWQLDQLRDFVERAYGESIQEGRYLALNPYVELFRFRWPDPVGTPLETGECARLGGMILLCHQLQILEELPPDRLGEAYETLCNSIRGILEADMCYLVSRRFTDTRMLCASSVRAGDLDTQLGSKEAGELLDQLSEAGRFARLTEGVFVAQGQADAPDALILPITLYDKYGRAQDEQVYLICQRREKPLWHEHDEDTLLRVRDTLFLRGQLAQALGRDMASLVSMAREYRDIGRKSAETGPLRILHISDLHVTEENCRQIKAHIGKLELGEEPFDFLVITGDVVQGRCAAGDLEQHYGCAAQVIRALAFRMWSQEEGGERMLRQDWKRRTIVIPGNHDYASMNELETQHSESHRASEGGRPAVQEGSAMAKFAYYIDFIRKLLDVEAGELIDNELNEVRSYDKIGIDFLCFNTSAMANPARNNKVHLDKGFAQRAIRRLKENQEGRVRVFLGHHGPGYEINYVSDEYYEPLICSELTKGFAEAVGGADQKAELKKLKQGMEELKLSKEKDELENEFIQAWLMHNRLEELPRDAAQKVLRQRKKTRFYQHLSFLLEQQEKDPLERSINERYQKIVAEVTRARLLSESDERAYVKVFRTLLTELKPSACLSGHTHTWHKDPKNKDFTAKRFQSMRLARKEPGSRELVRVCFLHYGVCEITPASEGNEAQTTYTPMDFRIPDETG